MSYNSGLVAKTSSVVHAIQPLVNPDVVLGFDAEGESRDMSDMPTLNSGFRRVLGLESLGKKRKALLGIEVRIDRIYTWTH